MTLFFGLIHLSNSPIMESKPALCVMYLLGSILPRFQAFHHVVEIVRGGTSAAHQGRFAFVEFRMTKSQFPFLQTNQNETSSV